MLPVHLQPQSHVPLYIQLRDQLRALVHAGDLRPGDRIPASRELATMPVFTAPRWQTPTQNSNRRFDSGTRRPWHLYSRQRKRSQDYASRAARAERWR